MAEKNIEETIYNRTKRTTTGEAMFTAPGQEIPVAREEIVRPEGKNPHGNLGDKILHEKINLGTPVVDSTIRDKLEAEKQKKLKVF